MPLRDVAVQLDRVHESRDDLCAVAPGGLEQGPCLRGDCRIGIGIEMRPRRRVQRGTLHVSILDGFEQQRDAVATLEQRRYRAPARVRAVAAPVVENDLSRGRLVEGRQGIDGGGFELGRRMRESRIFSSTGATESKRPPRSAPIA